MKLFGALIVCWPVGTSSAVEDLGRRTALAATGWGLVTSCPSGCTAQVVVVGQDKVEEHLGGWRLESTCYCTLGAVVAERRPGGIGQAERHSHIAAVRLSALAQMLPVQLQPLVACSKLQLAAAVGFPELVIGSRN